MTHNISNWIQRKLVLTIIIVGFVLMQQLPILLVCVRACVMLCYTRSFIKFINFNQKLGGSASKFVLFNISSSEIFTKIFWMHQIWQGPWVFCGIIGRHECLGGGGRDPSGVCYGHKFKDFHLSCGKIYWISKHFYEFFASCTFPFASTSTS